MRNFKLSDLALATQRLTVLTGTSPKGFEVPASDTVQPNFMPIRVPHAQAWLAQRPDLMAQEAELRARALEVKAVRAEFHPRLSTTGVLGFLAGSVPGLGAVSSVSWLRAPLLMAALFDRPCIEARQGVARVDQKLALTAYPAADLLATEEVENALTRYVAGPQRFAVTRLPAGVSQTGLISRRPVAAAVSGHGRPASALNRRLYLLGCSTSTTDARSALDVQE